MKAVNPSPRGGGFARCYTQVSEIGAARMHWMILRTKDTHKLWFKTGGCRYPTTLPQPLSLHAATDCPQVGRSWVKLGDTSVFLLPFVWHILPIGGEACTGLASPLFWPRTNRLEGQADHQASSASSTSSKWRCETLQALISMNKIFSTGTKT